MKYTLRHPSRVKRVTLKVEPPDQIIISAPKRTSKRTIESFIEENKSWIKDQLRKPNSKKNQVESKTQIMIFGRMYQKHFLSDSSQPLGIYINHNSLILNFPHLKSDHQQKKIDQELIIFLKKSARIYLQKQLSSYAKLMNVEYQALTLREQKTRWGSCSGQDRISLNWRLVHYPPSVINYVIVHELAHLIQRNHSRQFWQIVAQFDPDYSEHRSYLKKHGITFQ